MTLDEAIRHCEELVEQEECFINYPHSDIILGDLDIESRKHFVAEQRQLEEWLRELRTVRRLLKEAVRMLNDGSCNKDCQQCENHKSCDYDNRFKWKYTDEALKLIEEEEK